MGIFRKYVILILLYFGVGALQVSIAQEGRDLVVDSTDFKIDLLPFCDADVNYSCAQPYGDGLVFSSNKNKDWGVVYYSENDKENFSDLYYTQQQNDGFWKKPKSFSSAINTFLNEGAFCIDDSLTTIYFTTNREEGKKQSWVSSARVVTLKIYKATREGNKWGNIQPFIFNNDKYSVAHPSLSVDGKKLYFSSDMPGGFGGSDIYVCYLHNDQWSKPVNLGKSINGRGSETFPQITVSGKLYFSSDGRKSLGKLDIFSAEFINSEWKNVRNLGAPINTKFDDFGFYVDEKKEKGFLTSTRRDGKHDQLYKFQWFKSECQKNFEVNQCFTFFETATLPSDNYKIPLAYEWDLGDGTKIRGLEVGHCYAHEGNYKVELNIIDTTTNQLFFNEATYEVAVEPITAPYIECKGTPMPNAHIEFNGGKSKMPRVKITDLIWDFGDGQKAIGSKVKHAYAGVGKYLVTLYAQGKDSARKDVESCVFKYINISEDGMPPLEVSEDTAASVAQTPQTLYDASAAKDVIYKVQLKVSDKPIEITPQNFNGIKNVKEFQDKGVYGYTVGESTILESLYPLYTEVKVKGFKEAHVVSFDQNGKLLNGEDSTRKPLLEGKSYTHISGRVATRYGDPLVAVIMVEDLNTGKIVKQINNVSVDGNFFIELNNNGLYGFYAVLDSFYSVSNFIDLRNEVRNLEIKKNIDMISIQELNEENLALRINNLFFKTNEHKLEHTSYPELKRLIEIIELRPTMKIEIYGHTDNVGEELFNQDLSLKRAQTVKDYLVSLGCKADQISVQGFGSSKPLVSNSSERGRYINRRVEITFENP